MYDKGKAAIHWLSFESIKKHLEERNNEREQPSIVVKEVLQGNKQYAVSSE